MRLKIRKVGFAELDEILARIKTADGMSAGGVRGKVKIILSNSGVQCGASGRATDELHTIATEDSRTRSEGSRNDRRRVPGAPASNDAGAVHQPDHGRAVTVLPENVGLVVSIEVAAPRDVPGR
jgi:hypothetical protein